MPRGTNKSAQKKPAEKKSEDSKSATYVPQEVSLQLQQRCLDIFRDTFKPEDTDSNVVQEVKGHLYNREFAAAFGKEEYLRVYASRWSPSRTLGYLQVLGDIHNDLMAGGVKTDSDAAPFTAVCIGGGAGAEVVALPAWKHLGYGTPIDKIDARFVDIAAWDSIVKELHQAVTTPPELSKYASAAAKEANTPLIPPEQFHPTFHHLDALRLSPKDSTSLFQDADLVTLLFTLNELYTTSMPQTQQMLSQLTSALKPGACLLVVDSPGSYSTVSIAGRERKYPMQWLLDYTLIGTPDQKDQASTKWMKLIEDESRWFRLPQGLKYPIELENMRYQVHLYRRIQVADPDEGLESTSARDE